MTVYLDTEDLLQLTDDLGVGPVRDLGLLDSAAHRPSAWVLGQEAYPGIDLKAAVLMESIVSNHPLVDGNKRLGWLAVSVFYQLNKMVLNAPDDPAYDLVISVADGSIDAAAAAGTLATWAAGISPVTE